MFLDTSGLMCLFDVRDRRHSSAVEHYERATRRITHNCVLAEFVALAVARRAPLLHALPFINTVTRSPDIQVVWVGEDLHDHAMRLLTDRGDKLWSLCDAASFVIMGERNMSESLTLDHQFEQAGFIRLLDQ